MFILQHNQTQQYYSLTVPTKWTNDIDKAHSFKNLEAAQNYVKNCGLRKETAFLKYIDINPIVIKIETHTIIQEPEAVDITEAEAEAAYFELYKTAEAFGKAALQIPSLIKYYTKTEIEQTKTQEDLLHKIELMPNNNVLLLKFSRMLKKCREKRRIAKNRACYIDNIQKASIF